ncbi:MAG: hypothetical protein ACHQAX_00725 [Gammaproteobacteria bacterium]
MSEFQRSLIRNCAIGLLTASLCYVCYQPILSDSPGGHTAFTYGLLATSCTLCFTLGFVSWLNDDDTSHFKYMLEGARIAATIAALTTFLGLFYFSWLGLGGGFITGLWIGIIGLKWMGPNAVADKHHPHQDYANKLTHYYCKVLRTPLLTIPPLAFGGLLLFEWWGLGAGFIGGALISTLVLTLWGPDKPVEPIYEPSQPALTASTQGNTTFSHHPVTKSSSPVITPNASHHPTSSAMIIPVSENYGTVRFIKYPHVENKKEDKSLLSKSI